MDADYPVWTIRPNWREGVLERLEWLTDILTSTVGVEQRRALRLSPRRYVEITVNPTNNERSYLDLLMHKLGSDKWLFPLWFDQGKLSADATAGDLRVDFDNTYREHATGGFALLFKDAFTWEVISVSGQDDTGLDLDVVLDADWPAGTKVYPLRLSRMSTETSIDALTSTVGEAVVLFQVIEANDFPAVIPDDLVFEGMPVLNQPPNRSETITAQHVRLSSERDNTTGIPYRIDPAGRAFRIQSHSWIKKGRQEQAEFRSFLYWLRGRQRAMWLPSFNQDFVTSRASLLASVSLDIQKIGITYAGGVIPGRDAILVDGTPARITDLGAPQSAAEERLRIGAGLTAAVPAGVPGSFMTAARLNQDQVELLHHADSDGAMECSITFQTFNDSRDASGAILFPIPTAAMNALPCGIDFGPAQYLNVPATQFTNTNPGISFNCLASQYFYVIKPTSAESGGDLLYDAWSAWSNDAGIGASNSPVPGQSWDNRFFVYGSNGGAETLIYDPRDHGLSANLYATAAAAYAAISAQMPLIFTGWTHYRVAPPFDNNPGDNRGGISLTAYIGTPP